MGRHTETGKGLAATIHPNFRDSTKNPDHWHMHPVVLGKGTATSTYCVEAFSDGLSTAEGGVSIAGKSMTINVSSAKARVTADEVDTRWPRWFCSRTRAAPRSQS
jgi:hypothetical protein